MQIIDGKALANTIKEELRQETEARLKAGKKIPHLAAVLVGEDAASQTYVQSKVKSCEKIGFGSTLIHRPDTVSEEELLQIVSDLNNDADIDGFIVQLPLPKHVNEERVTEAIDPRKDVDGFHPVNIGRMVLGMDCYLPATPFGILTLLERHNIKTSGKHCVVVGRSNIVGRPISVLMSHNAEPGNCTVTLCHSRTSDLKAETLRGDILIVAIGKPGFITADMVKKDAIVIDVGIHRIPDRTKPKGYYLTGDVDYEGVAPKASWITPVPGGVGAMTVTALLQNTMKAADGIY